MGSSVILPTPGQPAQGADPNFKQASIPAAVSFSLKNLAPPSNLYVQPGDALELNVLNSAPGHNVLIAVRMLLAFGAQAGQPAISGMEVVSTEIIPNVGTVALFIDQFTPASNRTFQFKVYSLAEGYLLSVCVSNDGVASVRRGQAFASVNLRRFAASLGNQTQMLISDNMANANVLSWPGGSIRQSVEGPGWVHSQQQGNPAAGLDWTFTVPTGARTRVQCLSSVFTASAAVANRNVQLVVDDGANTYWVSVAGISITAGQAAFVSATGTSSPAGAITTDISLVFPPGLVLAAGHRIRTATQNIQVGDQWSGIFLGVEEWIEPT